MPARLKVFAWSDGFHVFTVAASSRPKALEAWQVEQDLFKTGLAHEVADGPDRDAALAAPGDVIRTTVKIDPASIETPPGTKARNARRDRTRERIAEVKGKIAEAEVRYQDDIAALEAERAAVTDRLSKLEARRESDLADLRTELKSLKAKT